MSRFVMLTLLALLTACSDPPAPVAMPPSPAAQMSVVEVRVADGADIRETMTLYGMIKPNAEREHIVRARFPGVVKSVTKRVGERIESSQTLLTIESNDSLEPYRITAPRAGTVTERNVNPGENVDGSTILLRLADLSTVWADFPLFSQDLGRVRAGMPISLTGGDGDLQAVARITHVAPVGDGVTQNVAARVVVDNKAARWVAGQFVTGNLELSRARVAVAVASQALQRLDGGTVVFVQTDAGYVAREVQIGRRDAQTVEIRAGLNVGERYAAKNSYLVKAEFQKDDGAGE